MQRILGITAEYDPFHRGHRYHLDRAKELCRPEGVLCVMSGDFTQRGEPAVLDKWSRAEIAARQGLDLVLELPFAYACSRAPQFAEGAVDLMAGCGVTHIAFGCEAEDPDRLCEIAARQEENREELERLRAEQQSRGVSYAKAWETACRNVLGDELTDPALTPNNILAIEYLKRIAFWEKQGRSIRPVPVLRAGSGYHEASSQTGFAGASKLRQMIAEGSDVSRYLPWAGEMPAAEGERDALWTDLPAAREHMFSLLQGIVLREEARDLARICCMGEGLEHLLIRQVREASSYDDLLRRMTSRRYTTSAIRRILVYVLTGFSRDRQEKLLKAGPCYGRLLAAGPAGRRILRSIDAEKMTIVSGGAGWDHYPERVRSGLETDARAADLYQLLSGLPLSEYADRRRRPVILKGKTQTPEKL